MVDAGGTTSELPISAGQGEARNGGAVSEAEKVALFKKAVDHLYGEKKRVPFKSKGPRLEGLKKISEWRNSDEVKKMGEGATLVQGLEADKVKKPPEDVLPEPAPVDDKDKNPRPAPVPPEDIIKPPPLKTDFGVGIVSDPTRVEQEIGGLAQHDRARKEPAKNTGFKGAVRGLLTPITNPREFYRNFWQNALFKGSFDARAMSFSRSMMEIARSQLSGLDTSIPFQMPQEILDIAIDEGRKIRHADKWYKRLGWTAADTFSGIIAFTQNSDMRYAEEWFKKNGKDLVTDAKKISLEEQTELGERFAIHGENKDVISKEIGETRYRLEDIISDQTTRTGLQSKIKELAGLYGQGQINDEELLKRFNEYYHKDVFPKIDAAKQKELEGIEVSSNVLRVAREMKIEDTVGKENGQEIKKTRYQRYQDEQAEDGQSMWNKLHFDIFLGRGKYEVARGEVGLSGFEENLIDSMVKREYKLSKGESSSAIEMAADFGIYSLAYITGGGAAVLMAGRYAFPVGGFALGSVVTGVREGVLVNKGEKLYGIRGKAVGEFEQVSRETATGRRSLDKAKIRPMFEQAMVDQRKATELTAPIESLLRKDTLSESEQKQLLQSLAHAKARLNLTDLSTKKGRAFLDTFGEINVAQNFIGFSQDNRNAEMTALRARIVQGVAKLAVASPTLYSQLEKAQGVYEAQLRVGSFQDKIIAAVSRDLKIDQGAARDAVNTFFEDLGIDNKTHKSLEASSRTLANLVDRKALTTIAFAAAVSPVIGAELHVISGIGTEAFTGLKDLVTGHLGEWTGNWGEVLNGSVPLTFDNSHRLVSGLSSLQKDALAVENFIHPPPGMAHTETIDGVQVVLPATVQHGFVAGHPEQDALVDTRTGDVIVAMDRTHLVYGDNGQLMVRNDASGQDIPAETAFANYFAKNGIHLIHDSRLDTKSSGSEPIFSAKPPTEQTLPIDGKSVTVTVPENTHWVHDTTNGKWDLVGTKTDGTPITLIDNATIKSNGQIDTAGATIYSHVQVEKVDAGAPPQVELKGGAAIVDYLKKATDVITTIAHRDVMKEQHALTTFVDSDGKIHITQGGYTAQNIISGRQSASAGMEQGNGVLFFTFGTNAERANLSHEGIMAHLEWHEKGNGGYGEYVFDPKNPGNDSTSQILASLINKDELAKLASHRPGDWLRQDDLAHLWKGVRGYEGGFVSKDADGALRMHDFEMEFAHGPGANNLTMPGGETNYLTTVNISDISQPGGPGHLGYRIEYDGSGNPLNDFISFLRPLPIRENVEKSVRGDAGTPINAAQNVISTPPTSTPPPSQENKDEDEESRRVLERIAKKEGKPQLKKSFEEYGKLSNSIFKLEQEMRRREEEAARSGDAFAYSKDEEYIKISEEAEKNKLQLEQIDQQITDFEIKQLPAILGGTFETIVANPKDSQQEVHGFYYGGFRRAFRQYILDYISHGQGVDSDELMIAYGKLKRDLNAIDPNVKLVEFDYFINGIVSALG